MDYKISFKCKVVEWILVYRIHFYGSDSTLQLSFKVNYILSFGVINQGRISTTSEKASKIFPPFPIIYICGRQDYLNTLQPQVVAT